MSRIRQVPHIEGNFSTHIYIPVEGENHSFISRIAPVAAESLTRLATGDAQPLGPLHVSISRHVYLKPHMIEPFLGKIRSALSRCKPTVIYLEDRLRYYLNEYRNTVFVALPVDLEISPIILALIHAVDSVMADFDMDMFYPDPSPHVSLVYSSNEAGFPSDTPVFVGRSLGLEPGDLSDLRVDVDCICVDVGNTIHRIHL